MKCGGCIDGNVTDEPLKFQSCVSLVTRDDQHCSAKCYNTTFHHILKGHPDRLRWTLDLCPLILIWGTEWLNVYFCNTVEVRGSCLANRSNGLMDAKRYYLLWKYKRMSRMLQEMYHKTFMWWCKSHKNAFCSQPPNTTSMHKMKAKLEMSMFTDGFAPCGAAPSAGKMMTKRFNISSWNPLGY